MSENSIENTLQSIDDTLKRIEVILLSHQKEEAEKPSPLEAVQDAVSDAISTMQVHPMRLVQGTLKPLKQLEQTDLQSN